MMSLRFNLLIYIGLILGGQQAWAAEPEAGETTRQSLETPVRGLYFEAAIGGGYTLVSDTLKATATYPQLAGVNEGLGSGAFIALRGGYDITDYLALQATLGNAFIAGTRADRVRDLGLMFALFGPRLSWGLNERLRLLLSPSAGVIRADNGVESADVSMGVGLSTGIEYYVHVRHLSLGLDVGMILPTSPQRLFAYVAPQLKYSF